MYQHGIVDYMLCDNKRRDTEARREEKILLSANTIALVTVTIRYYHLCAYGLRDNRRRDIKWNQNHIGYSNDVSTMST